MKRSRALLAALPLLALTLAGCSVGGSGDDDTSGSVSSAVNSAITKDASGDTCAPAGSASEDVKVSGEFGELLTLESKAPVAKVSEIERSVLIEGETTPFAEGESVNMSITIFNGDTGETINHLAETPVTLDDSLTDADAWLYEALRCGAVGQRAALVLPAEDAIGGDPAEVGITDLASDDSLVIVFDFLEPFNQFADCDALTPRDPQYPKVDLGDGSSEPTITIPECMEPPTELEIKVLVEGDGAVVEANQNIMTNYVGVFWNGAERFDGNWTETGIQFSTAPGALIEGFTSAMVGQKIGSTILVTVPSELGYNDGYTRTFVLQLVAAA